MQSNNGATHLKTRERLAIKVFQRTAAYDTAIANYLSQEQSTEGCFSINVPFYQTLRNGDNPHQTASLYGNFGDFFEKFIFG